MNVKGKKVILTGAGSGIGRDLTIHLLSKGAFVCALDINEQGLNKLKEEVQNNNLTTYKIDVSNNDELIKFKTEYIKEHNTVDILINNAGIIQPFINIDKIDDSIINKVMKVNFFAPVKLTQLFLPYLKDRGESNITNVSSMGGFFPFPGQSIYGASKAALKLFTEGLYAELADTNVNVMVVFPGAIATNIMENSNVKHETSKNNYKMLSSSEAAINIIDGIEKNKFQLFVGNDSKFMNLLSKLNLKKAIKIINKKMKEM